MKPISTANEKETRAETLKSRIALVTGGTRGIGLAIAERLARLGASIAICGRDAAALERAKAKLMNAGVPVYAQLADVSRAKQVSELVTRSAAALGEINLLVNNAGVGLFGPAHEQDEADLDRILSINLKSVFLMSKAVVPSMIRQGTGDIVNISSLAGKNTFAGGGIYCASKWGVMGLSGCMAEDLREYGIRVSVICPGSVATEFSTRGKKDPSKALRPEDVAHAAEMLVTQSPGSFVSEIQLRPLRKP